MSRANSFAPLIGDSPRILILGTMPGQRSLQDQQYYAHPRNSFWWVMQQGFGIPADASYEARVKALKTLPVILWDVLATCVRPGSLDAAIQKGSEEPNDFEALFQRYPTLERVICNGQAARRLFRKHGETMLSPDVLARLDVRTAPSTSPAYASLTWDEKYEGWSAAWQGIIGPSDRFDAPGDGR